MIIFLIVVITILSIGLLFCFMEIRNLKRVSHNQSRNINLIFNKLIKIENKKFFT